MKYFLRIFRGGAEGKRFALEEGSNLVGRWDPESGSFPEIDLENDDPDAKVSRKHAVVECAQGHVTLEDVGSLNGTFVNRGARLSPGVKQELQPGDELIVGKTFMKLEVEP